MTKKLKVHITSYPECRIGLTLLSRFDNQPHSMGTKFTRNLTMEEAEKLQAILGSAIEAAKVVPLTEWSL